MIARPNLNPEFVQIKLSETYLAIIAHESHAMAGIHRTRAEVASADSHFVSKQEGNQFLTFERSEPVRTYASRAYIRCQRTKMAETKMTESWSEKSLLTFKRLTSKTKTKTLTFFK